MRYAEVKVLQQQVHRKKECNNLLEKFGKQREQLLVEVSELEKENRKKQSGVNKLQNVTLFSFFYTVMGKKEEKLSKEQQEARVIKAKYESAVRELTYVEDEIRKIEEEVSQLADCEKEFYHYLQEGYHLLKTIKNARYHEITDMEQQIETLEQKISDIQETITFGKTLEWHIENMLLILEQAERKNGIYTQMELAEKEAPNLQKEISQFREKLEKFGVATDIEINVKSFTDVLGAPLYGKTYDNLEITSQVWSRVIVLLEEFRPIKKQVAELREHLSILETNTKQELAVAKICLEDKILYLLK